MRANKRLFLLYLRSRAAKVPEVEDLVGREPDVLKVLPRGLVVREPSPLHQVQHHVVGIVLIIAVPSRVGSGTFLLCALGQRETVGEGREKQKCGDDLLLGRAVLTPTWKEIRKINSSGHPIPSNLPLWQGWGRTHLLKFSDSLQKYTRTDHQYTCFSFLSVYIFLRLCIYLQVSPPSPSPPHAQTVCLFYLVGRV